MLGLTKSRSGDSYRRYQTRWALWKIALAGLIFAATCVAAIYAINLESYAPSETPRQTTGTAPGSGSSQPGTTGVGTGAETSTQTAPGNATRGPAGSQPGN